MMAKKKEDDGLGFNLIISVSALPKAGKNHFSYSAPDPIIVFCFNGGAEFVARKFKNKDITIKDYFLPIIESTEQQWASPVWDKFYGEYKEEVQSGKYNTVVLDTATEIENFCQQAVLEDAQKEAEAKDKSKQKLATNEYLARNLRMKAIFDTAKEAGVNLISLQYLKEEWVKIRGSERAEFTGDFVLDGWRRTAGQADINIDMVAKDKGGKQVAVSTIRSFRFDRDLSGSTLDDMTFDDLVMLVESAVE